ncbi:MAG TPA: hypothetical protein PKL78_12790 [Anaerolineales bacterium]|nr:hypothetical protein [Anaerolineales bacterium]
MEAQTSMFFGYMVLMANDDAVDKYNLRTPQIYEQLSRCLIAFLLGLTTEADELITADELTDKSNRYFTKIKTQLSAYPGIMDELSLLFNRPSPLLMVSKNEAIKTSNFFFSAQEYPPPCSEWLNITIVSAYRMGETYKNISTLLEEHYNEGANQLQSELLLTFIVRCMYAQAHTPEQRESESLQYGRFIELTYLKGNLISDIHGYVLNQFNENRFFDTYYNASRFCYQFIDDLLDYKEDTRDGILGLLHMHLIEQGRLAEKFLRLSKHSPITVDLVQEILVDTTILQVNYDQTYIHQTPYIQARRDREGRLIMESQNLDAILREIWVNTKQDLTLPIHSLASRRFELYASFKDAWENKDLDTLIRVIHISNIPSVILLGFGKFWERNKQVVIESHRKHNVLTTGYFFYYLVQLGVTFFRFMFWKDNLLRKFQDSLDKYRMIKNEQPRDEQ